MNIATFLKTPISNNVCEGLLVNKVIENIPSNFIPHDRSSSLEVSCEKGVLKNFAKITGKHQCQSFFFNKFVGVSL